MPKITLVVHNIRSTHNVGSIFRTAEGFGVDKIILSGYSPYPTYVGDKRLPHESDKITKQIHKTALGAETMVPFEYIEDLQTWIDGLISLEQSLPIYALEQSPSSSDIRSFIPADNFALLLGEEVNGIENRYLDQCEEVIEIPMYGQKESFNVSVAAGIALYGLKEHHKLPK